MGRSPVMLSAAKHLAAQRDRPFAELTLSGANVLRACPERSEWGDSRGADFIIRIILLENSITEVTVGKLGREIYLYRCHD
ncbi:MAG: hypothetical protein E6I80_09280 [Chloroflexi bacterium]|nr:MAG: hypothetical protein E6I80_09280 [Chloroflexota bacterium]